MRKLLLPLLLLLLSLPSVSATEVIETTDSVTFKFVPRKDMFFSPFRENEPALTRLFELIDRHKADIEAGSMPVKVDGYCTIMPTEKQSLQVAKIRSNRVKSEIISKRGLKEQHFRTTNRYAEYKGEKELVVVTLIFPEDAKPKPVVEVVPEPAPEPEPEPIPAPEPEPEPIPEPVVEIVVAPDPIPAPALVKEKKPYEKMFGLRTNLLLWAALTPNAGLEVDLNDNLSLIVNGAYTALGDIESEKVYRLAMGGFEMRYKLGDEKRWYVGGQFHGGSLSLKLGDEGSQGGFVGGGVTGGYILPLNRSLGLDFNIALGCTRYDREKYERIDGVNYRTEPKTAKNVWGPGRAGVHLFWKF